MSSAERENRLDVARALVQGQWIEGDVTLADGRIRRVGVQPAGRSHRVAVPGFIDLQVNGFAGLDFLSATAEEYAHACAALASTGVTGFLPTLVSSPRERLLAAVAQVPRQQPRTGAQILGVHLEGPFLSPRWPGAHLTGPIETATPEAIDELAETGMIRMVTLAPERPGALDLIRRLSARGITVAAGHTDADAQTIKAGFDAGIRALTHIYNAHRRWGARDPGPAGAALADSRVAVTVIADRVHLADETLITLHRAAGDRMALISDAIAAAGVDGNEGVLGARRILIDGSARLRDGTLAGSLTTVDAAIRNLVALGVDLTAAINAATSAPAALIGSHDRGVIIEGGRADIVVLDDRLSVVSTIVGGQTVYTQRGGAVDARPPYRFAPPPTP